MSTELVVMVGLGAALVVAVALWLAARAGAARARAREQDLEARLAERAYIGEFDGEQLYRLLGRAETEVDGQTWRHGLVKDEADRLRLFLVREDLGHLEPGDHFTAVRGQLVRLEARGGVSRVGGAGTVTAAAAPPSAGAARPARALDDEATVMPGREDATRMPVDEDATLMPMSPAPAPPEDMEGKTVMFSVKPKQAQTDHAAGLPYLKIVEGSGEGTVFPLPFSRVTIGRDKSNPVPLDEPGASRVHCTVEYRGTGFVLRDSGSTNGTFVGGERISERALEFGDRFSIAETTLCFSCEGHDLKEVDPEKAIAAFERCIERRPDFVSALKNLAFLLERNVARRREAEPLWRQISKLQGDAG